MGMHVGMIAAKVTAHRLRGEFLRLYPEYERVAEEESFPNWDAAWTWQKDHEEFVSAADWTPSNPGRSVYIFWQEGPWAVMSDPSYVHAMDQENLSALSASLGTVLSLVVETAGGCASFGCFEGGRLRRWIDYSDGKAALSGEPLPEEAGIDVSHFYMDEAEAIWKAFGLHTFTDDIEAEKWQAICVIDRTDYGDLLAKVKQQNNIFEAPPNPKTGAAVPENAQAPRVSRRPWWRIW
jgi:hypothetical protein